ncbi:MAG: HAMP domain-containing histidine kinase [Ruminococcaceae bacterium]|nr:HAMP domain-containing histidine kinase [Oscillospiraceae bacterium]
MSGGKNPRRVLVALYRYAVFFLLVAFILTCCMELFLNTMSRTMALELTAENLSLAAKLTFGNVILLSVAFTVIDIWRREKTVGTPVKRIADGAQRIMEGDFSARIVPIAGMAGEQDGFNEIIDCFNRMAQELSTMETLQTDFVANVSHELKTPLAVMGNYGTLLQQPDLPEEKRLEYAKAVTEAARRLAELVTNILKLNKLENQQHTPKAEPFDLSEQLRLALLGFEQIWEDKGIAVETELTDGVIICADRELLNLVWNNLFSNAFKFTPSGGRVTVRLCCAGEYALVQVQDTGCGISREAGARIFDKFYQADTSHNGQGNGLGLALVRRVVDMTRSEIRVESELGKGSTFTVKLRRDVQ